MKRAGAAPPIGGNKKKVAKKKSAANGGVKKVATRIRLPPRMKQGLSRAALDEYNSMRMKSHWVEEAIQSFLAFRGWKDQALDGEMVQSNTDTDVFYLTPRCRDQIDQAVKDLNQYVIDMNEEGLRVDYAAGSTGVNRGAIIRSAIAFRLFPSLQRLPEVPSAE